MLTELHVENLGVIDSLTLLLGPGMTALTGETGAGKTLVVEAIELLVGGRADAVLVRPGATEARVEGRFLVGDDEIVLGRVIPADGRSRAYVNGRLATVASLAEHGATLVDLHGQHAHQSLLATVSQRHALDRFGHIDLGALRDARAQLTEIDAALAALGGDERTRARELDILRYQLDELDRSSIEDPDEDARLELDEDALADAVTHREHGDAALVALDGDGGAIDHLRTAVGALAHRAPFAGFRDRLSALTIDAEELGRDLRRSVESIEEDPERLAALRARRQLLRELCRKYGDSLAEVMDEHVRIAQRADELASHDVRAAALDQERTVAIAAERRAAEAVAAARRTAAPALATAITANLGSLAMGRAVVAIEVGDVAPGDDVRFLLSANPGEPLAPLAKVASGGELARAMLAVRLVLTAGPETLVFDEVDAGIGGEAAVAVGRSLAALGADHQVLVVTHLPQVAAFAHHQLSVSKHEVDGRTVSRVRVLDADDRVGELARMLAGRSSERARDHAIELLSEAAAERTS